MLKSKSWKAMLMFGLVLAASAVNADQDGDIVHSEKLKVKDYTTGFDTCIHTFKNTSSCVTYKCNAGGNPETGADGSLAGAAGFIEPKSTGHSSERCGASWVCTKADAYDQFGNVKTPKNCKEEKKSGSGCGTVKIAHLEVQKCDYSDGKSFSWQDARLPLLAMDLAGACLPRMRLICYINNDPLWVVLVPKTTTVPLANSSQTGSA